MTVAIAEAWADTYKPPSERAIEMARLYAEQGMTLSEIGEQYGISRQRVDQILKPFGLEAHYGLRKKEERVRALSEAHARIVNEQSTTTAEAEQLGYASASQFCKALNELGLRVRQELPPAEHGTVRKYRQGCHCDECRRAHREHLYAWRKTRGVKEHGLATSYFNYACRCRPCTEAASLMRREQKARRRQAQASDE